MKVAVVILNWNGKRFLEEFLPVVLEHSRDEADVVVADNASEDDSVAFMREAFPGVRLILNDSNYGFAEGYNRALAQVEADYYVLLNSDIEVTEGWISPVIRMMEEDPRIGAAQPKLLSYHQRSHFEYAGAAGGYIDKLGYPFCRGRVFMELEEDLGQYDDIREVFWATGACLFVRAPLYHQLGGLDADFFAHMEEIDFCWRLKNAGYRVMYHPGSTVFHIGGGTLPKSSARKTYLNFRNNFSLLYKNLPAQRLWKVILIRLLLDGIAGIKFLLSTGLPEFLAVIRAHYSFYRSIPSLKAKRRSIQPGPVEHIYPRSLVFQHYIRGKKKFSELEGF
ncbi:MAG TPA: glycosyltransferase family 2 protein [Bacteroidales bacterium]|nr:glycosyltransferase family 2 protein [Bacteroidales bacterium]HRZ76397.1 glycosyltransferase family 2 protein [Bacteroidales bacterium]